MVSNCINPSCAERFTHFGRGELLLKSSPETGHQELFWMCEKCLKDWHAPADLVPMSIVTPGRSKKKKASAA